MLDLDVVFNPVRVAAVVAARRSGGKTGSAERASALPIPSEPGVDDLPGDWRVWFEERAAIKEFSGGLPREQAEAQALTETLAEMRAASSHEPSASDEEAGDGPDGKQHPHRCAKDEAS